MVSYEWIFYRTRNNLLVFSDVLRQMTATRFFLRVYFNIDKKLKKSIFNASNSILDIFWSLLLYNKKRQHMLPVSISRLPGMGLLEC